MIKIIKYFFESIFIYSFFLIIKLIGLSLSRRLFSFLFNKLGFFFKSKNTIDDNLNKLNGKYSEEKKIKIISDMWSNYGKVFVEYMYLKKFRKSNGHITIKGVHYLKDIINKKKNVIFVSGHFSNFELMSMELTKQKINLATIYRPLNNIFLNPFMEFLRKKYVCENQIKKGLPGVKHAIGYLKKNYSIALMVDQRLSEGKKLPLFNEMALTTTLPAQLALKFNIDIVPIYLTRNKDDFFEMEVVEPLEIVGKENTEENKLDISLKLNKIIEKMIANNPGQWIWTHNRWK